MTTIVEPSVVRDGSCMNTVVQANDLHKGQIVTNLGVVDAISRVGAFVVVAIRGTLWSVAHGQGTIVTLDVVWHESQQVSVDKL